MYDFEALLYVQEALFDEFHQEIITSNATVNIA